MSRITNFLFVIRCSLFIDWIMPIKWQPFKELENPSQMPDVFEEDDWVPFVPTFEQKSRRLIFIKTKIIFIWRCLWRALTLKMFKFPLTTIF